MRQITFVLVLGALVTNLALPALAGSDDVKIGVAAPMTGALAKMGGDIKNGAQLAIDEANAKGGVLGKRITLIVGDDKGDPREGIVVANKLVQSGVVGVDGHLNSGISIPASREVYAPAGVAMVSPASTNPDLTERGLKNVFRTIGRDDQQGKDAAEYALKHGYKKVAILHNKNAYGQGLAENFRDAYIKGGGQVLVFDGVMSGDKDFTPTLTRIKSKGPDLLFFGGEYQDGGLLAKQMRRAGLKVPMMGGDGLYDHTFITLAGVKAAEGSLITFPAKGTGDFAANYTKKYGPPGAYSGYSYDATRIIIEAVKRAGKADRALVLAQIAKTKNFKGATGTISFNKKGDQPSFKFAVWRVEKGDFKLVP